MSVLIKGMEMPKCCPECQMFDWYVLGCKLCSFGIPSRYGYDAETKPDWCTLIEVPEHGRLIDADAFFKDICNSIENMTKLRIGVDADFLWAKLNDALDNAPTVIPADKDGET